MGCCSSKPPQPLQPNDQLSEAGRDVALPVSSRGRDPDGPANLQISGSTPAHTPSQSEGGTSETRVPKPGRLRAKSSPTAPSKSKIPYPSFDITAEPLPVSRGEISQKPSGRSRFLSSHDISESATAYSARDRPLASSSSLKRGHRHQNRFDSAPDPRLLPRSGSKSAAVRGNNTKSLPSTLWKVLPNGFRFRILVLGKVRADSMRRSGKSSVINAIFNVDMAQAAAPGTQPRNAGIDLGFSPSNNSYLVVHEYSAFETGDAQSLQTVQDFISYRTNASRSVSEKLHLIWVCIPMSEAIESGLGEGVKKILGTKEVPVLIVFTNFERVVSSVQSAATRSDKQNHGRPKATGRAHSMYDKLCRSLFHKDPKDAPAAIFSEKRAYRHLLGELTSTTHRFIKAASHDSTSLPTSSQVRLPGPPITPILLAWSVAQRVDHDISIQASIEVGRTQYWRNLGSSRALTNHALESCVNVIHEDIANVWNFNDREGYLLTPDFTARISLLVEDLAGSPSISSSDSPVLYTYGTATPWAGWVNGTYENNQRNIRCIVAYIVDLTIILYRLFMSRHGVSETEAQSAVMHYANTDERHRIHDDIRSFVAQSPFNYEGRDTTMETIIDLIKQNCVNA
ncbi:hypothetical protein EI94DRAFT_1701797 [Lactarius quietus]|nr:hypothetical protein EI94DRAFT_1701797 [Lactarius quietus]